MIRCTLTSLFALQGWVSRPVIMSVIYFTNVIQFDEKDERCHIQV
jgi:hypothetical protein